MGIDNRVQIMMLCAKDKDADVIERVNVQHNKSYYLRSLVRKDIEKKNKNGELEERIKRLESLIESGNLNTKKAIQKDMNSIKKILNM